ncbi:MAG: OmpA family protein, partial [Proteobacteria bacterium]|nr:OmpA family protein [Pseudomonadota bacterium]
MRYLKSLAVFAVVAVLGACSGPWDIENLRGTTRTTAGTPFTQALTQEYRSLTLFDADQDKDWPNAYIFAAKGLAAARGENVLPENPANWRSTPSQRAELDNARGRLIAALDGNGRTRLPDVAAKAQAKYDCWIEETEEGWQEAEIAACRGDFEALLAQLIVQAPPPPPPPPPPVAQREFIIYFDWDSARITPEGLRIVDQVAGEARNNVSTRIVLVGHADLSGPASYNLRLSLRRADAVRAALAQRGVATERTSVTA